jgi:4-hydroxy-tetrahydrodipicolinate synthase
MDPQKLKGTWTALATPFNKDLTIDWKGFKKNIEFQIKEGITGILPVGTTGESPTLDWKEHEKVIEKAIEFAGKRCLVMAGVGSNSTAETILGAQHAAKMGADAVLLVDCYYNGPSSLELRKEYYEPTAKKIPETIIVPYIIPGRTGTAMTAEDLAILNKTFPNVCAVKEATGDIQRMAKTRELLGNKFIIFSGDDDITFTIMSDNKINADGVISVMSNIAPGPISKMVSYLNNNKTDEAEKLNKVLSLIFSLVTVKAKSIRDISPDKKIEVEDKFRNPIGVKTIMNGLGLPSGPCRQPLGKINKEGLKIIKDNLNELVKQSSQILSPIETHYGVSIEERLNDKKYWQELVYKE